jgi:hypothetical protein
MAAVFEFSESNGAGEVVQDNIANLNFGNTDAYELVTADWPIVASENAYEKYIRAKFSGTFTEISNMKFWKSVGAYVTGEDVKAAANVAYTQPVKTTSSVATVTIPVTEGTALAIEEAGGVTGLITSPGYTKYLCLQLQTTGSTPAGAVNTKTFTFQYDEI